MENYFTFEKVGDVQIVTFIFAELSLEDADGFKKSLYSHVSDSNNKFIIDFHQCVFMSSVALGALVSFTTKIHSYDGRIVFCAPTKEVSAILAITKFDKIYDIYRTRKEALASFMASDSGQG